MNCPICKNKLTIKRTEKSMYSMVKRSYYCESCKISMSSDERINFLSIPKQLREKYLESGKWK